MRKARERSRIPRKIWYSIHPINFGNHVTVRPTVRLSAPQAYQCIVHFTVKGGNEAGVDLVLIQPFLLFLYVNHVVLMLTSIF